MTGSQRALLLGVALAALWGGLGLLRSQPLPDRAAYTGLWRDEGYFAPEVGALAPPLALTALTGERVALLEQRGRPIVLNFWATWCAPCEAEMPELQALADAHPGVTVYGVNLSEAPGQITAWLAARGLDFPVLLDASGEAAALYRLRGQPTTFVIAPDGTILSVFLGATTRAQLEQVLQPFL